MIDVNRRRYSLCVKRWFGDECKFYRLADFEPNDKNLRLVPAEVHQSNDEVKELPDYLWNTTLAREDGKYPDFVYLEWQQRYDQFPFSSYEKVAVEIKQFPSPIELLLVDQPISVLDVPKMLQSGVPYPGDIPTESFGVRIVNGASGRRAAGAAYLLCRGKDFVNVGGALRFKGASNVRSAPKLYPVIQVLDREVIGFDSRTGLSRYVCASFDPKRTGQYCPTLDFAEYAPDYVKWYADKVNIQLSRSQRRDLGSLVTLACDDPGAFEDYLIVSTPIEEGQQLTLFGSSIESAKRRLKSGIADILAEDPNSASSYIADVIKTDDRFREECERQATKEAAGLIAEKQAELEALRQEVEAVRQELTTAAHENANQRKEMAELEELARIAKEELDDATAQKDAIIAAAQEKSQTLLNQASAQSNAIIEKAKEDGGQLLKEAEESRDSLLSELEDNVAMRLGLRAVASTISSVAPATANTETRFELVPDYLPPAACSLSTVGFRDALAKNLRSLGVVTNDATGVKSLAAYVGATLGVCDTFAATQQLAAAVADAISLALSTRRAQRVCVAPDCMPTNDIVDQIAASESAVVLVDGALDAVNEPMLMSDLASRTGKRIVFSYRSLACLRLVTPEAWSMVFPLLMPSAVVFERRSAKGALHVERVDATSVDEEDIQFQFNGLSNELGTVSIPDQNLVMTASVYESCLSIDGLEELGMTPEAWVAPQLLVSIPRGSGPEDVEKVVSWAGSDGCPKHVLESFARGVGHEL